LTEKINLLLSFNSVTKRDVPYKKISMICTCRQAC